MSDQWQAANRLRERAALIAIGLPVAPAIALAVALALALTLALTGCSTLGAGRPSPSPGVGALAGREFLSTAVTDGGAPYALVAGTRIRLTFQAADLGASAGCNMIGGQYRVEDGRLIFTGTMMTEMACPDGRDQQDNWLIGILTSRPAIVLSGNELTIEAGRVTITLLDREIAEPDQELVGPSWIVVGIVAGDVVSSIPAGVFATIEFRASGEVAVDTGCNAGSGRWLARDGTIQVTDLGLTKKACAPPLGEVETAIVEVLRAPSLTVDIEASSMTLSAADRGLQLQAPGLD
jgi:heat shock protein HslJ